MINSNEKEIMEGRRDLLKKAKEGKLSFGEFNMLNMHRETRNLLAKDKPTLSEEGLATLLAIELCLESFEKKVI